MRGGGGHGLSLKLQLIIVLPGSGKPPGQSKGWGGKGPATQKRYFCSWSQNVGLFNAHIYGRTKTCQNPFPVQLNGGGGVRP